MILICAAIILPPTDPRMSWAGVTILVFVIVWVPLTFAALGIYFYRGWRRIPLVPNKATYIAWLSFETACTIVLTGGLLWVFVSAKQGDSISKMRDLTFRQDLLTMRSIVSQYTLDNRRRPRSLDDLVAERYLKEIPTDPMTGRKDTWVLKCSKDPANPGIEEIESGYRLVANRGIARCD